MDDLSRCCGNYFSFSKSIGMEVGVDSKCLGYLEKNNVSRSLWMWVWMDMMWLEFVSWCGHIVSLGGYYLRLLSMLVGSEEVSHVNGDCHGLKVVWRYCIQSGQQAKSFVLFSPSPL